MIKATIKNNIIALETPFHYREKCVAVRGGVWSKPRKAWEYPLTPVVATDILTVFGVKCFSQEILEILFMLSAGELTARQALDSDSTIPIVKTDPWKHQRVGYHFSKALLGLGIHNMGGGAMLAMDMGSGKSKIAVDLINNYPEELRRVIIACPKSAIIDTWTHPEDGQIVKHGCTRHAVIPLTNGTVLQRASMLQGLMDMPVIAVINYESIWREAMENFLEKNPPDLLVCDEIHRIKDPSGRASKFFSKMQKKIKYRLGLSGTPMPHSPMDIFGSYRYLDPGVFGKSYINFRSRYAVMGGFNQKQIIMYINQDEMTSRFYRIAYRVETKDVLDLPPWQDRFVTFQLDPDEKKIYQEMEQEFVTEVEGNVITASNALSKLLRLQQITSGFIGDQIPVGTSKAKALEDVMEDFDEKEPVIVFVRFTRDLRTVEAVAKRQGRRFAELSGAVNQNHIWQRGDADVLGVQIQSGKESVDFTRARYSIYYSLGFSLGDYNQSRRRTDRPGQTREGIYIHLVAEGTVDKKVIRSLAKHEDLISGVLRQYKEEGGKDGLEG